MNSYGELDKTVNNSKLIGEEDEKMIDEINDEYRRSSSQLNEMVTDVMGNGYYLISPRKE